MQHFGPVVRQLSGFPGVKLGNDPRVGHDAGVGGEQPGHVFPERHPLGTETSGEQRRGEVGAAAAQGGDLAVWGGADEARHHRHDTLGEHRGEHPVDRAVGAGVVGRGLAERGVGVHQVERVHVLGSGAARLERGGYQPRAQALAPGDERVGRARGQLTEQTKALRQRFQLGEEIGDVEQHVGADPSAGQERSRHLDVPGAEPRDQRRDGARLTGSRLLCHLEERVSGPRHRGDDHDGGLGTMAADDLDRMAHGSGIGQRRTAELVDVRRSAGTGHGGM